MSFNRKRGLKRDLIRFVASIFYLFFFLGSVVSITRVLRCFLSEHIGGLKQKSN